MENYQRHQMPEIGEIMRQIAAAGAKMTEIEYNCVASIIKRNLALAALVATEDAIISTNKTLNRITKP